MSGTPALRKAGRLLDSGLFDPEFHSALRGRAFADPVRAALDHVEWAMPQGLAPHPLLDLSYAPLPVRRAWRNQRVAPYLTFVSETIAHRGALGPLLDPDASPALLDELRTGVPLPELTWAREAMMRAAREGAVPSVRGTRAARTSLVVMAGDVNHAIERCVRTVLTEPDTEVLVVATDLALASTLTLAGLALATDAVRQVPSVEEAADRLVGDVVVLLDPRTHPRSGWLHPLREALDEPGVDRVQPLVLGRDEMIQAAGAVAAADGSARRALVGHPREDVRCLEGVESAEVTGPVVACRSSLLRDLLTGGGQSGGAKLVPHSRVTSLVGSPVDVLPRALPIVHAEPTTDPLVVVSGSGLRWSLNLPSTGGHWGDAWGDTMFAEALARGLRHLGQDVVIRRRDSHQAGPIELDDVHLTIRGLQPAVPTPGVVNVVWVISHPDTVTRQELLGFDLVYAASPAWAAERSAEWGIQVRTLLQATEVVAREGGQRPKDERAVFVGSRTPRRDRPLVKLAVAAGIPLVVHGRGWEGDLPRGVWESEFVDNHRLADVYGKHALVLADHWPDMAAQGFIANRVFDAVAAGGRVASDAVLGIGDVFGAEVTVVSTPAEMRRAWEEAASSDDDLVSTAAVVHREHSFLARAQVLLSHVVSIER